MIVFSLPLLSFPGPVGPEGRPHASPVREVQEVSGLAAGYVDRIQDRVDKQTYTPR